MMDRTANINPTYVGMNRNSTEQHSTTFINPTYVGMNQFTRP